MRSCCDPTHCLTKPWSAVEHIKRHPKLPRGGMVFVVAHSVLSLFSLGTCLPPVLGSHGSAVSGAWSPLFQFMQLTRVF